MIEFFYLAAFIAIAIASYTDIRTREVPDLLNYGLIFFAASARIIYAIMQHDWNAIIEGILGGAIGFGFGALMYYTGQWGGGDTKLISGLGILIGLPFALGFSFFTIFLINILFAGAFYALALSIVFAIENWKKFLVEFEKINERMKKIKIFVLVLMIAVALFLFVEKENYFRLMIFSMIILLAILIYLYAFVKAVEKSAMIKKYPISKLTEGDWIVEDVYIGKKLIAGPKDLGITKEKIEILKKSKIKTVVVKEGIPFVPSFFIAFIATYFLGNWISFFF